MIEDELEDKLRHEVRIFVEQLVLEGLYPIDLVREALVAIAGEILPRDDAA